MLKDSFDKKINDNKSLPEIFADLKKSQKEVSEGTKEIPKAPNVSNVKMKHYKIEEYVNRFKDRDYKFMKKINIHRFKSLDHVTYILKTNKKVRVISSSVIGAILIFVMMLSYTNYIYATDFSIQDDKKQVVGSFETNENSFDIERIIETNSSIKREKKIVKETWDIQFETQVEPTLMYPDGEEVIIQEGSYGKENVTLIKTFENGEELDYKILERDRIVSPVDKVVQLGTNKFLAKNNIHFGDIVYLSAITDLKDKWTDSSNTIMTVGAYTQMQLLDANEEWCKVSIEGIEGYMRTDNVVTEYSSPGIIEKTRVTKILSEVNFEMPLNEPSGLTAGDFRKVLSGNINDRNKIFENNAEAFYVAEQLYHVNGLYLAAIGIHESAWGTSKISLDKKNLFGYGANDGSPYDSAFDFETYQEGIETLAKSMAKYYLNDAGVDVQGELSTGKYYNGSTLSAVNIRYASDPEWANKVYSKMSSLYSRLKLGVFDD